MKFKNYIEVQSGIKDSADSPGTLDQVLTSTATGVAWVDPSTISAEAATLVAIECKNTSGATITKGTPVYQTGTVGATDVIEIAPADALISAGKQPAIGLLQTTLNNNGFGKVVITGEFLNFTTDPIDGVTPTTGDKVFLKSGGGLTLTKPTGAENGIQNLGLIGKVSGGNAGSITVSSIMRTNDVPNLPTGKIWVGDGNTIVSDTVFLDEPNGRMGIGTTSPGKALDIRTNGSGDGLILTTSQPVTFAQVINGNSESFPTGIFGLYYGTSQAVRVAALSNSMELSGGHAAGGSIRFRSNTTEVMRMTNVGLGIGTTSPTEKLHVRGGNIRIDSDNSSGQNLQFRNNGVANALLSNTFNISGGTSSSTDFNTYVYGDNPYSIWTNNVNRLTVSGIGNVGIGTTNPSSLLHVSSGTSGDAVVIIESDTDNNNENDNPQLQFKQDGGNTIAKAGLTGDQGQIFGNSLGNAAYFGNDENASVQFYTNATAALTIREDGDVGIGTTSPNGTLNIRSVSSTGSEYNLSSLSNSGTQLFYVRNDGVVVVSNNYLYVTSSQGAYFDGSVKARGGITDDGGTLGLGGGGNTNHLNILTSGNVGIGTTSPTNKLDVIGTLSATDIRVGSTASGEGIIRYNGGSGNGIGIVTGALNSSAIGLFVDHSANNRNVGIGTTSPGAKLDVNGEIRSDKTVNGISFSSTGGGASFSAFDVYTATNGGLLRLYDENGQTVNIDGRSASGDTYFNNGGNVGIGTTSPSQALEVNGNIQATGTRSISSSFDANHYMRLESNSSGGILKGTDGGVITTLVRTYGDSYINGGNVGIGTTSPSHKLQVDGGVYATNYLSVSGVNTNFNLYNNGTTYLNGDTTVDSTFLVTNGNVGIGTTNPLYKLQVQDRIHIQDITNLQPKISFSENTNTTGEFVLEYNGASSGAGNYVSFYSEVTGWVGKGSGFNYIPSTGSVGIGTTNPLKKLSVNGGDIAVNNGNGFIVGAAITGNTEIGRLSASSGQLELITESTRDIKFASTAHGNIMFLEGTNGNVGIGTTSPGYTLAAYANTTGSKVVASFGSALDQNEFAAIGLSGFIASNGATKAGIALKRTGVYGTGELHFLNNNTLDNSDITLSDSKMMIDDTGNVGIGTTSPSTKLHVVGSAGQFALSLQNSSNGDGIKITTENQTANNGFLWNQGSSNLVNMYSSSTTNASKMIMLAGGVDKIFFNTEGSSYFNGGNVGIGTTNPSQKFHVAGNMRLQNQLYDSTNSAGTNGEVLTKVSAGTEWKVPAVNAQMPDNTAPASAANVGTIRYRSTSNTSFMDMSMQTGATTYAWVNIVSNFW